MPAGWFCRRMRRAGVGFVLHFSGAYWLAEEVTIDPAALGPDCRRIFVTTLWGTIQGAQRGDREAQARLYQTYLYPLYAYFRRRGATPEDAEDLVQDLFLKLLSGDGLRDLAPEKGKVRTWLLRCACNHWLDQAKRAAAGKRGGEVRTVPWDALETEERFRLEPPDPTPPELQFDRAWARALIERALSRLREELQAGAREEWFDRIKGFLEGERERGDYERVAGELSTTPNALKVAVHRLRTRLRELLREEVGQTVECADQVNQEIRDLIRILGG